MSGIATAVVVSGVAGAYASSQSAKKAAGAQTRAAEAGISEERAQFEAVQELLKPYVEAGTSAIGQQQALLGLSGQQAQQQAISQLEAGPQFQALQQQGENALLQNAAATGGLRGGNLQSALAQFRPQLLSNLINQQYQQLGGISQLGQASAAGQASAGLQTGGNIATLLGQQGSAQAGASLAQGQAIQNAIGTGQSLGTLKLLGAF